eukprot:116778-Pyramimonas_sp.AAC.1
MRQSLSLPKNRRDLTQSGDALQRHADVVGASSRMATARAVHHGAKVLEKGIESEAEEKPGGRAALHDTSGNVVHKASDPTNVPPTRD